MEANAVLIFLLFFSALILGFLFAKYPIRWPFFTKRDSSQVLDRYRESVNFLINEQPDAAIDALTATLDVNAQTLETHMALGAMLRKRGEVDRAIRVHQNILSRQHLTASQALYASLALAEDYLKAGLLDRAEALYTELSQSNNNLIAQKALARLLEVYQLEGEWLKAVTVAEALSKNATPPEIEKWRLLQAHFYCELAEHALLCGYYQKVSQALNNAEALHTDLARVGILRGHLALVQNDNHGALVILRQVFIHFTACNAQVLPLLIDAFNRLQKSDELHSFLARVYHEQPSVLLLPAITRVKAIEASEPEAIAFLVQALEAWPALEALGEVLHLLPANTYHLLTLEPLLTVLEKHISRLQAYECQGCGYSGNEHHWQCPSCKNWETFISKL